MHTYETCVILNAQLVEEERTALLDKLRGLLVNKGALISEESAWGKRKLAYEIEKAAEGCYHIFFYDLPSVGDALVEFERVCRYEDNVLRWMTVKSPKKRKGVEIKPIVPSPGWMAEFSMRLRPVRRRADFGGRSSEGGRGGYGGRDSRPERRAPPVESRGSSIDDSSQESEPTPAEATAGSEASS